MQKGRTWLPAYKNQQISHKVSAFPLTLNMTLGWNLMLSGRKRNTSKRASQPARRNTLLCYGDGQSRAKNNTWLPLGEMHIIFIYIGASERASERWWWYLFHRAPRSQPHLHNPIIMMMNHVTMSSTSYIYCNVLMRCCFFVFVWRARCLYIVVCGCREKRDAVGWWRNNYETMRAGHKKSPRHYNALSRS